MRQGTASRRRRLALRLAGLGASGAVGGVMFLLASSPAMAYVSPPCHATVYVTPAKPDSVSGAKNAPDARTVVVDSQSDIDVPHYGDYLSGEGNSGGVKMQSGEAHVVLFGAPLTVASGQGEGTSGSGGPLSAGEIADRLPGPLKGIHLARSITVSGTATPKDGGQGCTGNATITWDDVSPTSTVAGVGGLALGGIGLLTILINLARGLTGGGGAAAAPPPAPGRM